MRMLVRLLSLVLLGTLAAVAAPGATPAAQAQCGNPAPFDTALVQANTVFVGEVVSLSNRNREASMRVIEVWKGRQLPATVVVEGGSSDPTDFGPDDRTFQEGRTYLVFSDDTRSPFGSDRCAATKLYTPLGGRSLPQNAASALGINRARAPMAATQADGATADDTGGLLTFISGSLVLAAFVAGFVMYRTMTSTRHQFRKTASAPPSDRPVQAGSNPDSIGKLSRRFSVAGLFGRSGLQRSEQMRAKRKLRRTGGKRRS